jgi:hypothetical protein
MDGFEVIYSYSRAQAIADGYLINVTAQAREAGIRWHTVVTDHLFTDYLCPTDALLAVGQSLSGRLWDTFALLRSAIATSGITDRINFTVLFLMSPKAAPVPVELVAVCGPGDQGEPVITIMLPEDD